MFSRLVIGNKRNLRFDSPPIERFGRFPTKSRPPVPRFPILAYIVARSLNRYADASIFKKGFQVHQAYSILRHALIMIFTEFPTTLRTLRTGLAITAAGVLILVVAAPNMIQAGAIPNDATAVGGTFFLGVLICMFGYVVMIVSWHRYVLMNNTTGALPPTGIVLRYIGTVILLALLAIACSLAIFTPISILTFASQSLALGTLLSILAIALVAWIIMRCSLPLPAISIGAPMTFSDSWTTTRPVSGTIFLVMVAVSLLNAGISVLPDLLLSNLVAAYAIAQVVLPMLTALISASVLTTLYGMLIEGRPLPD